MTLSRVALVTGASSGFGQATAALLAMQGFQVFGISRAPGTTLLAVLNCFRWTSVRRHPF